MAVTAPATSWPRAGRVVVADTAGWLAGLAVVSAALTGSSAPAPPTICPVTVRFRTGDGYLAPEEVPRRVADAVAMPALVIEVRCLPAVPADSDRAQTARAVPTRCSTPDVALRTARSHRPPRPARWQA